MPLHARHFSGRDGVVPVIVGAAAWNGLAATPHTLWAFLRAELTPFAMSPFQLRNGQRATMGAIRTLPPRALGSDRLLAVADRLLVDLHPLFATMPAGARVGIALSLPERMSDGARAPRFREQRKHIEAALAPMLAAYGFVVTTHVEPRGHAAGAFAALQAAEALQAGTLDVVLWGGLDTCWDPDIVQTLDELHRLYDGENLDSFIPGEGGAFLVLTRPETARQMRWPVRGRLTAAAYNQEIGHSFNDVASMGLGLSRAALAACEQIAAERRVVDWWLTDLTPETWRVHEFQLAWPRATADLMREGGALEHLPTTLGDLGAATMPTGVVLAIEGMQRGFPVARTCVVTGSSLGADRGVVVIERA